VRMVFHGRSRRSAAWDSGFPNQNARMQDSADAFGQPIRHLFAPVFRMQRLLPGPDDASPVFRLRVEDPLWYWGYPPIARIAGRVSGWVTRLQQGRISIYLLYSFLSLVILLVFVA
ncbi:MAG: hydrogenase 4 subunit B, partial [Burkholderiales bacterium]